MVLTLAGVGLMAGLGACGGSSDSSEVDAAPPPVWSVDDTYESCEDFATIPVGGYVLASNYWNKDTCPGTQCVQMNKSTGAFAVTSGPKPCGNNVASYPNVLYGCSYGNCSPGTILPLPVTEVQSLTSSWSFSVGGNSKDAWNVSYDIWFCPDKNCGASGFPKGLELMIWLDYKNAHGWKDHLGTVTLSGYTWDVWSADMQVGGATDAWAYMNYIIKPNTVNAVTDLNLNAFIQDAVARGYAKPDWYLYAVQAGIEVRAGGMPYVHKSFSVTLNGQTPSTVPIPVEGPVCNIPVPTMVGQLDINDTYVSTGPLHGYGSVWTAAEAPSTASVCAKPKCNGGQLGAVGTCAPTLEKTSLCAAGTVGADPTYHATAGLGFMLNQVPASGVVAPPVDASVAPEVDGGIAMSLDASVSLQSDGGVLASDGGVATSLDGGVIPAVGTITIPNTISLLVDKSADLSGNLNLRLQMTDDEGNLFCYGGSLTEPIPVTKLNTMCWNNKGVFATPSTRFNRLDIIVPSSAVSDQSFAFCLGNVVIQ